MNTQLDLWREAPNRKTIYLSHWFVWYELVTKLLQEKKNHIKCTPGVEIHYLFLKFYEKFCLQKTNINVLPYIKKNQVCYILCLFEETTRIARMESFWTPLVLIIVLLKGMFLVIKSNYVKHIVLCFISWF
jgi:hypothetical protein